MLESLLRISRGVSAGYDKQVKFGRVEGVTAVTDTVIAPFVPIYLTAASLIRIKAGGNAADTAAGTGARAVFLTCLDENYNKVVFTLVTNGASASLPSSLSVIRVLSASATLVGSGGVNIGAITIEAVTGGSTQALIPVGQGQTQQLFTTIPAGHVGYIVDKEFSLIDQPGAGTTQHLAHFKGRIRLYNESSENNYESWRVVFNLGIDTDGSNNFGKPEVLSEELPEKTDIQALVYSHIANCEADGRLFILLINKALT